MLPRIPICLEASAKLRAAVLATVWMSALWTVPSWCQSQPQSSVPHPPAALTPQTPAVVPHPPETEKQQTADTGDQPSATFKVNVKLVNVFTTVTDANGAPISSLKKDDFEVFEDGEPQQIAVFRRESELPLSIVVAIDTSLSTRVDQKLELESARRFAHDILRPIDALSLFEFSEVVNQLTPFTSNLRLIDRGINRVHSGAATALYDTLYLGADALMERRGRKVMVVITDGGDTISKTTYQQAVQEAQEAEVIIYSIIIVPIEANAGRDIGGEHALIQLSRDTGGKYFYASGLNQLDAAFHKISEELRTQYLIAYYPSRRLSDSDFRSIEIKINPATKDYPDPSQLVVRHRTGYYTMPSK
ncbi:MAG TPA: VWA domain-containing protein [Terriglobales bacterium]|nr:VWA domain-containing protein [Terriglobales bacterium]